MHPTILAQRKAIATDRILERSATLVQHLELDPALADRLRPAGVKDLQTVEMLRLEALAEMLSAIAEVAGAPAAPVTDVTVREFIAPSATAVTEEAEPVPTEGATPEELPPPVIEGQAEGEGVPPKTGDELVTEPVLEHQPASEEGAVTAVTEEEEPAPKPKRSTKSTRAKRK